MEHANNVNHDNTFCSLLRNDLILRQISPYIPLPSLLRLAASCKALKLHLLSLAPASVFTRLDLQHMHSATLDVTPLDIGAQSFRAERMDEALTEDEFYCGPLRGVFGRLNRPLKGLDILRYVQVLILDGLSVPADLVREIIGEDRFSVKILSIRGCAHLNETKLRQVLDYAIRPGRAEGSLKLKGLYVFGPTAAEEKTLQRVPPMVGMPESQGVMSAAGAQIGGEMAFLTVPEMDPAEDHLLAPWYLGYGKMACPPKTDWGPTLLSCQGLISFDAVLCRGPRHDPTSAGRDYLPPKLATIALGPKGCETCGTCPERPAVFDRDSDSCFPLLAPPPLHSTSARAAQRPQHIFDDTGRRTFPRLILRCEDCLRGRWCERCNKWWCETCYAEPTSRETAAGPGEAGWPAGTEPDVKVYFNVCVASCLRSEINAVVDGMWG